MTNAVIASSFLLAMLIGWAVLPVLACAVVVVMLLRQSYVLVSVLVLVAAVLGALRSPDRGETALTNVGQLTQLQATISSGVINDGRSQRFRIRLENGETVCAVTYARTDLGRGDRLLIDLVGDAPEQMQSGFRNYLKSQGCMGSGTANRITLLHQGSGPHRWLDSVRNGAAHRLVTWVPGDRGALLAGLVIGDDAMLSDSTADAFVETGTYHIVAISGSNLSLLLALVVVATAWSRRRGIELIPLLAVWAYVLVGGSGPPTLRAGLLTTIATGGRMIGRPVDLLTLSLQVAAIQAAIWPTTVLGLSFRLSTVAILVVVLISGGRKHLAQWHPLRALTITSLVVNLALMPIFPAQSRPSLLLAVIANTLIAVPAALAFVLGLLALLAGLVSPGFGEPIAIAAGQFNALTIGIVRWLADQDSIPGWLMLRLGDLPTSVQIVLAVAAVMIASVETRRWLEQVPAWLLAQRGPLEPIAGGIAAGMTFGVVTIAIMR